MKLPFTGAFGWLLIPFHRSSQIDSSVPIDIAIPHAMACSLWGKGAGLPFHLWRSRYNFVPSLDPKTLGDFAIRLVKNTSTTAYPPRYFRAACVRDRTWSLA